MRFWFFVLALTLSFTATAQNTAPPIFRDGFTSSGALYFAQAQAGCVWSPSGDVGPCINAAYAACAAASGGTVVVPAGIYGIATTITNPTSGCHLLGAGVGNNRDSSNPNTFIAITRLVWTGMAGGTILDVEPSGGQSLYSADVWGVVFDCASLANICAKFEQVSYSFINIGVSEPRSIGALFTTEGAGFSDAPGNQGNDIWVQSRSTSSSYSPTGIMFDGGPSGTFNTSYNRMHELFSWFAQGDGIVFGNSDNNIVYDLRTSANPGNATGRPAVFASTNYTSPNGVTTNGGSYNNKVLHTSAPVISAGFQSGATVTPGSNAGSAALASLTLSTNGATTSGSGILHFASTTGVAAGESVNCGGVSGGVVPGTPVLSLTGATVSLNQPAIYQVGSGTSCTFYFGITNQAVPGTYTVTAASSSTFNITAPTGGHTQSGISYSGGFVSFTDIILPMTGTPVAGDTFVVVVPSPASNNTFEFIDQANSVPFPTFENGSTGYYIGSRGQLPLSFNYSNGVIVGAGGNNVASGNDSASVGGQTTIVSGALAAAVGGAGVTVSGFGAAAVGGHNNGATGSYATVSGEGSTASGNISNASGEGTTAAGSYSRSGGSGATDRGRYATDVFGSGEFAAQGDAQTSLFVLRCQTTSTATCRLTADGLTAGSANCVNTPNASAYSVRTSLVALDHTVVANNYSWALSAGLLTRGANAASTAWSGGTPVTLSNGSVSGLGVAVTADTTNGCLSLVFTPPSGNTDTWNAVVRVETVEVQ